MNVTNTQHNPYQAFEGVKFWNKEEREAVLSQLFKQAAHHSQELGRIEATVKAISQVYGSPT